ncbi:hypothetical protein [Microbacterium album]|uniref:Uncharacterized protein n=1 Tax=Microbacterium album TaxID=2053191 RepID=A0A917IHX5_9MICO|nr:hypothetical protein [Microbacterium album]GGH48411.1 hypothetical protein GCM10010921_25850 [Microbacterium album]
MSDSPFLVLLGSDPPSVGSPSDAALRDARIVQELLPDLVGRWTGVTRASYLRLVVPDARGDRGPHALVVLDVADASTFTSLRDTRTEGLATSGDRWFLGWERRPGWRGTPTDAAAPYVFLVGMDAPADADEAEIDAFNAFYDDPHVPEVVSVLGYQRGIRYANAWGRVRSGDAPPAYLAAYDGDEDTIRAAEHPDRLSAFTEPGPEVWQRRTTHWRLVYRRVGGFVPLSGTRR